MPAFLKTLTREIYNKHKDRLGDICIVLPNRRAILFIKNYLADLLDITSFLPEFYAIEDFVAHTSGHVITDSLHDQFTLYNIHRELEGDKARSIEEFFPYAAWMLSDFNEIDMYLVDKDHLYTDLSDVKAINLWNPDGGPLTDFEIQYLAFFRSIKHYYDELTKANSARNMAHQGYAFRMLSNTIEEKASNWTWHKIIFAGFNALTPSEEKIIAFLKKEGKAEIYWDADDYYLNDTMQEAGYFLRGYFKGLFKDDQNWISQGYRESKDIQITGVPGNAGQLKYAGELLSEIAKDKATLDDTALVLSDESLLLPMLNSIPSEAGRFNVTMGLSLGNTPLYTLIDGILSMQRNVERFTGIRHSRERLFYSKDLLSLVSHPWITVLISDGNAGSGEITQSIRGGNRIFIPENNVLEILYTAGVPALIGVMQCKHEPAAMLESLSDLIDALRSRFISLRKEEDDYRVELEYIFRFSTMLSRMKELVQSYRSISTMRTLQMIYRQLSQQEKIAFRGEPLQGLQIMGMLETRTLDFDTVIMLSVNEGTLPSGRLPNSFIPFEMKRDYGLPTYRHKDAVFAYHFYRLLQRAKNVHLLYSTESDGLGGGEKSRFITQLLHEAVKYNPDIHISENLLSMPPPAEAKDTSIEVEKDQQVLDLIKAEAEKGFHPSSLSLYINCPLQFYFSRLAKVEELDEMEETIDARALGTIIHKSLHSLLNAYVGKNISRSDIKNTIKKVREEVNKQFASSYHIDDIRFGKNYLVVNVAGELLEQTLAREAEWIDDGEELLITDLEETLMANIDIQSLGRVNFRGTADRIDRKGGRPRILDYKTGGVDLKKLNPAKWEQIFEDPDYRQAFQLMMYAWLYYKSRGSDKEIEAGIISLRSPGNGPAKVKPPGSKKIDQGVLEEFEQELFKLITEIYDPATPFKQTDIEERCKYCSFNEMCNRVTKKENY